MIFLIMILAASAMSVKTPLPNGLLPPKETFKFDIDCGALDSLTCEEAKESIDIGAYLISQELYFSVPLVVRIQFQRFNFFHESKWGIVQSSYNQPLYTTTNFCESSQNSDCIQSNITYPISVLKANLTQTLVNKDLLERPDLELTFNTNANWVYSQHYEIGKRQMDLKRNLV